MAKSSDLRWRAVSLIHVYDVDMVYVASVLGVSRSVQRWYAWFLSRRTVEGVGRKQRTSRWPHDVCLFVSEYAKSHPCFYIDELRSVLKTRFPTLRNVSGATICRALHFDLHLTRKVLTKRAREAAPVEIAVHCNKLLSFYSGPEQLVFIDETAKAGRDCMRRYARPLRNVSAVVDLPFRRGERVSLLAAMDTTDLFAWEMTRGMISRREFHKAFREKITPLLNPWPFLRSIEILDNAKIHMYRELEELVHSAGALLFFLPPYYPQLNPIEVSFFLLKCWIMNHANIAFRVKAEAVMEVALRECTRANESIGKSFYCKCGYAVNLVENVFVERVDNGHYRQRH